MLIEGKFITPDNDMSDINNIRYKVFIEELKIKEDMICDGLDEKALHVVIYENDNNKKYPVAGGRIIIEADHGLISHVAVIKDFRGKGYGDLVVRMLVNKAFEKNIPIAYVNTPINCRRFFEKIGFTSIDKESKNSNKEYKKMVLYKEKNTRKCM